MLAGAAVYSLQIVLMERYAPRYDALAFTLVEMLTAFAGLLAIALAAGDLPVPHGWTVWGALLVTGVFASALAFLAQTWAQRRTTRDAHRARVHARAGLGGALRLHARGRPARRAGLDRLRRDHGRDRLAEPDDDACDRRSLLALGVRGALRLAIGGASAR